jgi:hypothetical protein
MKSQDPVHGGLIQHRHTHTKAKASAHTMSGSKSLGSRALAHDHSLGSSTTASDASITADMGRRTARCVVPDAMDR